MNCCCRAVSVFIRKFLAPILILLIWEASIRLEYLSNPILPSPLSITKAWTEILLEGTLASAIIASCRRILIGYFIAALVATICGFVFAKSRTLCSAFSWLLEILRPISPLAWIPFAVLFFGAGEMPSYFVVFIGAFFPILVNAVFAFEKTERSYLNAAKAFGASKFLTFTDVIWPSAKPYLFTGYRVGLSVSWLCVIAAELMGVKEGLGYLIQVYRLTLNTERLAAVMLTIGLIGLFLNFAISSYMKHSAPWLQIERRAL